MVRFVTLVAATLVATAALAQMRGQTGGQFDNICRPPLKFAAGACVAQCPAGYEDRGSTCQFRSMSGGGSSN